MSLAPDLPQAPERPRPDRRWGDVFTTRLGPWIDWFGPGRLAATALTVVVVVAGGWWLLRTPAPPTEARLPFASTTSTGSTATTPAVAVSSTSVPTVIVVHVAGAVARPGVYELPAGARVNVALDAAGGARSDAESGSLNLAAPLGDGTRIYVPTVGEEVPPTAPPPTVPGSSSPPGPLDLNRATATELDDLPGIGPATAAAIVEHRTTNGPFASVDDLEAVRGIGPAKLDTIRPLVMV